MLCHMKCYELRQYHICCLVAQSRIFLSLFSGCDFWAIIYNIYAFSSWVEDEWLPPLLISAPGERTAPSPATTEGGEQVLFV